MKMMNIYCGVCEQEKPYNTAKFMERDWICYDCQDKEGLVITPPDVQRALADQASININSYSWASLDISFEPRFVRLKVGSRSGGKKYIATYTIHYYLQPDGSVVCDYAPGL